MLLEEAVRPWTNSNRKVGRVVYCTGLENRRWETIPGFESLTFRQIQRAPSGALSFSKESLFALYFFRNRGMI